MVKNTTILNIFIPNFLHYVLQTIDEVASVKLIKGISIIEVIIPRQENEGKFWFIRSCSFLMPVTGIKIYSTAEMSDGDVIIAFKETMTTLQG